MKFNHTTTGNFHLNSVNTDVYKTLHTFITLSNEISAVGCPSLTRDFASNREGETRHVYPHAGVRQQVENKTLPRIHKCCQLL
jgi:hypothetical protein